MLLFLRGGIIIFDVSSLAFEIHVSIRVRQAPNYANRLFTIHATISKQRETAGEQEVVASYQCEGGTP